MRGHLAMSKKERNRLLVLSRVRDQGMSLKHASSVLSLSYRQVRRVYQRYLAEGDVGLIRRSRGRPSGRGFGKAFQEEVITLYRRRYEGFGATLASEKLASEGYRLDHETLRRWLLGEGLIEKRRKRTAYRKMRVRREHFGELVQMDGSHHAWFEDRADTSCLMNMVDDSSDTTLSLMDEEETTEAAMCLLWAWIDRYGVPEAIYTDRKNIFITDREPTLSSEQLKGEEPLTHFGRACKKLGTRIIPANSPQAKGRVERSHGVYQDRLVKEFRLKGINTIKEADQLLEEGFVDDLNKKFAIDLKELTDRHRPLEKEMNLAAVFSYEEERSIANDFTVRYKNRFFQITKQANLLRVRGKRIIQERLDGSIHLIHQGRDLPFEEISKEDMMVKMRKVKIEQKPKPATAHIPPADHPWRRSWSKPSIAVAPQ